METETLSFINPATGVKFGEVETTTSEAVQQAVDEMRSSSAVWSAKSVRERIRVLRRFQAVLIDRRDEITGVLNQDCGKSRQDGLLELIVTVDMLAQHCAQAPKWLKSKRVSSGLYLFKQCFVEYRPHGVVAVIAPWNYPLTLALPPLLAALLAGNTVVLKPSEVTAATGVLIENLIQSVADLDPFVRVVHGGAEVGAALVTARPDYIFATGSTSTGRKILQAATEHLIPVALELGGKDAMIVLDDADIDAAARWGVWGAFFNTGQSCMAVERVYVIESKYDEFVRRALNYAKQFKLGYSTEADSPYSMGPVSDPRQVDVIEKHLDDALAKGACILMGGREQGMFYSPIVMVDVDHSMLLMREETFGPIMPIMKVRDEAEAIRLANDNRFGLGASVWSRDIRHAKAVADKVEAASVILNDSLAQFGIPMLPFGGIKDSGFGRTHGQEGLMQFTRSFSYAVGGVPSKWDIATVLRENGRYNLATAIMGVLYGTTLRQKWETLTQLFRRRSATSSKKTSLQSRIG
ncbi:MAG TPA: aldehyde dehydrogenase family protein [Anaerolineales bacterium]|nr:aldehyde dehydrogenase family protein [Anaerolineales bacterium]